MLKQIEDCPTILDFRAEIKLKPYHEVQCLKESNFKRYYDIQLLVHIAQ